MGFRQGFETFTGNNKPCNILCSSFHPLVSEVASSIIEILDISIVSNGFVSQTSNNEDPDETAPSRQMWICTVFKGIRFVLQDWKG